MNLLLRLQSPLRKMLTMNILYLGADSQTSAQRAEALRRMGHDVMALDPARLVFSNPAFRKLNWELGGLLSQASVTRSVQASVGESFFDFAWVDSGRYIGPSLVRWLQNRGAIVLNYNHDDPFGRRDRFSWRLYLNTVPAYDLLAVVREENVAEARARGARNVVRVFRSADEVAHAPRVLSEDDYARCAGDVCFVGTWMPERGPFMAELIRRGAPLTLYGNAWQRAREWPVLRPAWRGPDRLDDEYPKTIQSAKICLGLLSKGNRDLHTTRSAEVPYMGGLFCAERTTEHQLLYEEGTEAVFWQDAAECAEVCRALLQDEPRRREIARRGRERCIRNGTLNEQVMGQLLSQAFSKSSTKPEPGYVLR